MDSFTEALRQRIRSRLEEVPRVLSATTAGTAGEGENVAHDKNHLSPSKHCKLKLATLAQRINQWEDDLPKPCTETAMKDERECEGRKLVKGSPDKRKDTNKLLHPSAIKEMEMHGFCRSESDAHLFYDYKMQTEESADAKIPPKITSEIKKNVEKEIKDNIAAGSKIICSKDRDAFGAKTPVVSSSISARNEDHTKKAFASSSISARNEDHTKKAFVSSSISARNEDHTKKAVVSSSISARNEDHAKMAVVSSSISARNEDHTKKAFVSSSICAKKEGHTKTDVVSSATFTKKEDHNKTAIVSSAFGKTEDHKKTSGFRANIEPCAMTVAQRRALFEKRIYGRPENTNIDTGEEVIQLSNHQPNNATPREGGATTSVVQAKPQTVVESTPEKPNEDDSMTSMNVSKASANSDQARPESEIILSPERGIKRAIYSPTQDFTSRYPRMSDVSYIPDDIQMESSGSGYSLDNACETSEGDSGNTETNQDLSLSFDSSTEVRRYQSNSYSNDEEVDEFSPPKRICKPSEVYETSDANSLENPSVWVASAATFSQNRKAALLRELHFDSSMEADSSREDVNTAADSRAQNIAITLEDQRSPQNEECVDEYELALSNSNFVEASNVDRKMETLKKEGVEYAINETVEERIESLKEQISKLKRSEEQARKLRNYCLIDPQRYYSVGYVEAEKYLLLHGEKIKAAEMYYEKLYVEKKMHDEGCNLTVGSITIKDLHLPLDTKKVYEDIDANVDNFVICLIIYEDRVYSTSIVRITPNDASNGYVSFPDEIHFGKVYSDFAMNVQVYTLQRIDENGAKERAQATASTKKTFTPKKWVRKETPTRSNQPLNAPDDSNFAMVGKIVFSAKELRRNKFTIMETNRRTKSPLASSLRLTLISKPEYTRSLKNFLTFYQVISESACWIRYWCALRENRLMYWQYPDQEQENKPPIGSIDLSQYLPNVTPCSKSGSTVRCNSFELCPKRTHILDASENTSDQKKMFCADSAEDMKIWIDVLNNVISTSNTW